ncbi:IS3 family transposase [Pedobacter chinensis]|uniref:IS3 family transposase n=1 Tax=Pedobacter chinensis TaxID=2282421 RepID=UPI0021D02E80|nr:IS3 family transposase [Pedobacter chinensis]
MAEHKAIYPVEKMSSFFGISSSSYHKWAKDPVGFWKQQDSELLAKLREVCSMSLWRYGSPRIAKELNADGIRVSLPRIARLMGRNGINSIMKRKYRVTTNSNHLYPVNENLLLGDFSTRGPGQKWVSDITYIRTAEGWPYLTVIMNLADRKIVGWSMDNSMSAGSTVVAAWEMATRNRPVSGELMFHSDRGIQYASHVVERYTNIDERYGKAEIEEKRIIIGSMYPENICFDGVEHRTARLSEPLVLILLINSALKGKKNGKGSNSMNLSHQVARRGIEPLFPE